MAENPNQKRIIGDFDKLNTEHISDGSRRSQSAEERRRERVRGHYSRQAYRRYGGGHEASYYSVVFRETLLSIFAVALFALYIAAYVMAIVAIILRAPQDATLMVVLITAFSVIVLGPPLRRLIKRGSFMRRLRRLCRDEGMTLYVYRNWLRSLYRAGNCPDLAVECGDTVYECMFFPAPKRLSVLRFEQPGRVHVVTGIVKNRFKEAVGARERVCERDFGFEPQTRLGEHRVIKAVVMNPVPYQLFYYDSRERRVVQGGSGAEVFGYVLYSSSGLLNTLERHGSRGEV